MSKPKETGTKEIAQPDFAKASDSGGMNAGTPPSADGVARSEKADPEQVCAPDSEAPADAGPPTGGS
jgi:hypothetical protein